MYSRLVLNMNTNQKLRFRWNSEFSELFSVSNDMKQGGVISTILFCVYMDGLLNELANSGLSCHIGGMFVGAFDYADDFKLLTPRVWALYQMARICKRYAQKFDVLFNSKKS